jgi:Na+-transporting NADH:ubiquinone oxidoreductase subunit D
MANPPGASALDGLGNSLGYSLILIVVAFFRELFGSGNLFGFEIMQTVNNGGWYNPNGVMVLSPGAFFIIGFIIWVQRWISPEVQEETN